MGSASLPGSRHYVLDFPGSLAVAFGLQLPVEVPQLGLKVPLVGGGGAGVGPLGAWRGRRPEETE